jgi:hypothetical protein
MYGRDNSKKSENTTAVCGTSSLRDPADILPKLCLERKMLAHLASDRIPALTSVSSGLSCVNLVRCQVVHRLIVDVMPKLTY